jgi:hypothetical protein
LSKLLTPLTNKSNIKLKNSYKAKEMLKSKVIPNGYSLVSFDVKSLFTSIPIELAIISVKEFLQLHPDIFNETPMNENEIISLVEICLKSSFF